MKLRREARTLKAKALSSLRRGLASFNGFEEDGRVTTVLLHLQHCCEMLVKAALVQKGVSVFDKSTKQAEGFARSLNLASAHCGISAGEAGVMRAVDSLRDAEQHWLLVVPEDLLFLHVRGLVTVVDEILKRSFSEALVDHLPNRVLPRLSSCCQKRCLAFTRQQIGSSQCLYWQRWDVRPPRFIGTAGFPSCLR